MIRNYRDARQTWTPVDWGAFCKQALIDANKEYASQLLREATDADLDGMVERLNEKLRANARAYSETSNALAEVLTERRRRMR